MPRIRPSRPQDRPEFGTPEMLAKPGVEPGALARQSVRPSRNTAAAPVDAYARAGHISSRQHRAAVLFRSHWLFIHGEPRVTSRYTELVGKGSLNTVPDIALLKIKLQRAVDTFLATTPKPARDALIAVVGLEE